MEKINIRGVLFDSVSLEEACDICMGYFSGSDAARVIHTPNSEIVQLCVEDKEKLEIINSADLIIPDGAGVILASKILKTPLTKGKVAGIELCERLVCECANKGIGVYFLGGKPGVAEKAKDKLCEKYPGLTVSGISDGYFKDEDAVIEKINQSGASLLLVCLGAPKQEIFMNAHRNQLNVKLMGGFGGSFDVFAGEVKRAPKIFIKLGLEWFYRLLCDPRRIGRMMKLPKFILGVMFSKK